MSEKEKMTEEEMQEEVESFLVDEEIKDLTVEKPISRGTGYMGGRAKDGSDTIPAALPPGPSLLRGRTIREKVDFLASKVDLLTTAMTRILEKQQETQGLEGLDTETRKTMMILNAVTKMQIEQRALIIAQEDRALEKVAQQQAMMKDLLLSADAGEEMPEELQDLNIKDLLSAVALLKQQVPTQETSKFGAR